MKFNFVIFLNIVILLLSVLYSIQIGGLIILFFKIISNFLFVLPACQCETNIRSYLCMWPNPCLFTSYYFHSNCTETYVCVCVILFSLYFTHNARSRTEIFSFTYMRFIDKFRESKIKYMNIFILHFTIYFWFIQCQNFV